MLHLAALGQPIGAHLGGWRHRDAYSDTVASLENGIEVAQIAERGKFDLIFLADGNGVKHMANRALFSYNEPIARPGWFEPLTYLSAVAMHTKHIGLVATATTTYEEPYSVARKFASLDKISNGRAGWNIVTTSNPDDSLNFNRTEHVAKDLRYDRASEFVDVVRGLWNSWAEDAFPQDKASGRYLDPDKVKVLNHKGEHFAVKGPLNMVRSPQGSPLLFNAGGSEAGKELAARVADCVFGGFHTKDLAQAAYRDAKDRTDKYGRSPDSLRIFPGAAVYVGRTETEADELYDELKSLIDPTIGVHYLSKHVQIDLSKYPIDGPMPAVEGEYIGLNTTRLKIGDMAKRENLTIRQTMERIVPTLGHPLFKGNPTQIADQMEDWYRSKACDGFLITAPVLPRGLRDFVDLVVPELQRRGIFRKEYTGKTLRENMRLPAHV